MQVKFAQGPYDGHHALILMEARMIFRFMDLPAEIRNMIYVNLLVEDEPIIMSTTCALNELERPCRVTYKNAKGHEGLTYNKQTKRYMNQPPSALAVLRLNKQVFEEAGALVYASNRSQFSHLFDLKIFVQRVGTMRSHIRHITITGHWAFYKTNARSAFFSLRDATGLRSLTFNHIMICGDTKNHLADGLPPSEFAEHIKTMIRALHKAHKQNADGFNVLDIIKVDWVRCICCRSFAPNFVSAADDDMCMSCFCSVKCRNLAQHCKKVEAEIRKLIAEQLRIKE